MKQLDSILAASAALAYDEVAMDIVAKAIYCAARPDLATMWNAECAETRLHYMDLASAAFLASLEVLRHD